MVMLLNNDTEQEELLVVGILSWHWYFIMVLQLSNDPEHKELLLLVVDIISWCAMTLITKNYLLLILYHGVEWHWSSRINCCWYYIMVCSDNDHQELLVVDIIPWCVMTLIIKNYLLLILYHGVQWLWSPRITCCWYYTMVCNVTEHQKLLVVDIIPWCAMTLNIKIYLLLICCYGVAVELWHWTSKITYWWYTVMVLLLNNDTEHQ